MIHDIGHLSSRPRIYRRHSLWRRVCLAWDCTDLELAVLAFGSGYVGILLAWCARHMATGSW
jgi:hypothetical protein